MGARDQARRDIGCRCGVRGDKVRLFTRRSFDWSKRYPAIARTAAALRCTSFTIDGEAVVRGPDGVAIFDALHRRGTVNRLIQTQRGIACIPRPRHRPRCVRRSSPIRSEATGVDHI
jgi:hypothetical protein